MVECEGWAIDFKVVLSLYVRDNNEDTVLSDGLGRTPVLTKTEYDMGVWSRASMKRILLHSRLEVFVVVKYFCSSLLLQMLACLIVRGTTIYNCPAKWGGIHIIVMHFNKQTPIH